MHAIIFCGIQASGKSTFYREHFFNTHMRISLDLLRTRNRENRFLELCLQTQLPFVVDNTNPTAAERARYIALAKAARYKVTCYFLSQVQKTHCFATARAPDASWCRRKASSVRIKSCKHPS